MEGEELRIGKTTSMLLAINSSNTFSHETRSEDGNSLLSVVCCVSGRSVVTSRIGNFSVFLLGPPWCFAFCSYVSCLVSSVSMKWSLLAAREASEGLLFFRPY